MTENSWCSVAPINEKYFDEHRLFQQPVEMGHGVRIGPMPEWVQEDDFLRYLSVSQRQHLEMAEFAMTVEYEASSLGDPDPEWGDSEPKSMQYSARQRLIGANLALWIARPSSIGFHHVVDAEQKESHWTGRHLETVLPLLSNSQDEATSLTSDDLERAKVLLSLLATIQRQGAVWMAIRTLWKALIEREWEIRFLCLWIALEALFGPNDARETTFRLSLRMARFLATDKEEQQRLFVMAKKGYRWRSQIVHGMRVSRDDKHRKESGQRMREAETLIREALTRILTTPETLDVFSGERREGSLDNLMFL